MLPKYSRLNLKKDFKWVASGKKIESSYLKLYIKTGDNDKPKIGIALSSKSFRKAHDRNRAKRLVSSAFETLYPGLPSNVNIVALPKEAAVEVKSGDILLDLISSMKDEKIID